MTSVMMLVVLTSPVRPVSLNRNAPCSQTPLSRLVEISKLMVANTAENLAIFEQRERVLADALAAAGGRDDRARHHLLGRLAGVPQVAGHGPGVDLVGGRDLLLADAHAGPVGGADHPQQVAGAHAGAAHIKGQCHCLRVTTKNNTVLMIIVEVTANPYAAASLLED